MIKYRYFQFFKRTGLYNIFNICSKLGTIIKKIAKIQFCCFLVSCVFYRPELIVEKDNNIA